MVTTRKLLDGLEKNEGILWDLPIILAKIHCDYRTQIPDFLSILRSNLIKIKLVLFSHVLEYFPISIARSEHHLGDENEVRRDSYPGYIKNSCNNKRANHPIKKRIKDVDRHFPQRRNTNGQEAYEKMLNIIRHEGNTDKNCSELPLRPS